MPIPTYTEWKTATHQTRFGFQTGEFKKLDSALKKYDGAKTDINKNALKTSLDNWIGKEAGFDWKNSLRNETGVVEKLHTALNPYRAAPTGWTAPPLPALPDKGKVYLGQSFEYANSKERDDTTKAFERARLLINSAYLGLAHATNAHSAERTIYTDWFGAYDANRLREVRRVVNAIHGALFLKPVVLYFRGNKVTGPSDCPAEVADLTPGGYFGAAWKPQNLPNQLDEEYTYIFLGKAFFKSGMYALDSIAGVIIHELSHSICGTDDVDFEGAKTYGVKRCKNLATKRPDLAVKNADCYEYLCEAYQTRNFVPTDNPLVLPPKASITLSARLPG